MKERSVARSRPDFSPGIAIVFSMPLFVAVSAWLVPWLWDLVVRPLGWTGVNPALLVRDWFMERCQGLLFVSMVVFSPVMVIFCVQTKGHNALRFTFLTVHLLVSVAVIGPMLLLLGEILKLFL
jgi:hypothetical protein